MWPAQAGAGQNAPRKRALGGLAGGARSARRCEPSRCDGSSRSEKLAPRRPGTPGPAAAGEPLLELDLGAGVLELLGDVLGLRLADGGLDLLGRAIDEVLGVLEAQA